MKTNAIIHLLHIYIMGIRPMALYYNSLNYTFLSHIMIECFAHKWAGIDKFVSHRFNNRHYIPSFDSTTSGDPFSYQRFAFVGPIICPGAGNFSKPSSNDCLVTPSGV